MGVGPCRQESMLSLPPQRIAENLTRVKERMAEVATACGRQPEQILLVAVTKYVGVAEAQAITAAGCRDLGESRPQELWQKAAAAELADIRWHLVGHLQRNKVRRTLPLLSLLHSLDSDRLAQAIDGEVADHPEPFPLLLEVNCSGDATKHGVAPEAVRPLYERLLEMRHLNIRGLMTMAARSDQGGLARKNFARLRELRDELRAEFHAAHGLDELSMGMSGDYEDAIREGATIVRIGSALFL